MRPLATTIEALGVIGWHVTELRPSIAGGGPALWHLTIERYDRSVFMPVTLAEPDDALEELARYAAADAEKG